MNEREDPGWVFDANLDFAQDRHRVMPWKVDGDLTSAKIAVEEHPTDPHAHKNYGEHLFLNEQDQGAKSQFLQTLLLLSKDGKADPLLNVQVEYLIGVVYYFTDEDEEALKILAQAYNNIRNLLQKVDIDKQDTDRIRFLAEIHDSILQMIASAEHRRREPEQDEAERIRQRAEDQEVSQILSDVQHCWARPEAVEEILEKVIEKYPQRREPWYELARLWRERGEIKQEARVFQRMLTYVNDDAAVYFRFGELLKLLGKDAVAEQAFQRAIQLDPEFSEKISEV